MSEEGDNEMGGAKRLGRRDEGAEVEGRRGLVRWGFRGMRYRYEGQEDGRSDRPGCRDGVQKDGGAEVGEQRDKG